jgi:hypothetical protein
VHSTHEVRTNHRELQIESNRAKASCIRFCSRWGQRQKLAQEELAGEGL